MRLDPLFQTKFRSAVVEDGRIIGEVYMLPVKMSEEKGELRDPSYPWNNSQREPHVRRQMDKRAKISRPYR